MQRQSTRLFEQRNSFATLRDLFRWAQREAVGYQQLAENGYMLLAERVRKEQEKLVVKQVIEKVIKVRIEERALYGTDKLDHNWTAKSNITWTKAMRRLVILVSQALVNNEPVLLVGETGCGKTTVCQALGDQMGKELHIVNAHQNTETGDIIGGQRPYRDRLLYQQRLITELRTFFSHRPEATEMDLDELAQEFSQLDVDHLLGHSSSPQSISADIDRIRETFGRQKILFEWADGALVQAMKRGEPFLLDEISLADDSVLERLNSVLEPGRSLMLAEKGGDDVNVLAAGGFQFFATMNPGGDYGKKELSPALRNRFTEIWVPAVDDHDDLIQIVNGALNTEVQDASELIVDFSEWFSKQVNTTRVAISVRDILAWVQFINATSAQLGMPLSLFHGAMMVYVDGIGTTAGTEFLDIAHEKRHCLEYLSERLSTDFTYEYMSPENVSLADNSFSLGHFSIARLSQAPESASFSFRAPTAASNGMKVLRAMQLPKSILLEGAPGIGKTSLISAIAGAAGQPLTRINLSDQTDLMDLFGSDAPVEGGRGGEFAWRDAPFLRAMQNGEWVLLDELNLASQSVLEGLNACLDHRGTAYVPELNRSFTRHPNFRIFAAQNPHSQGGGRKGLPKSFVNRFSVVHVASLTLEDMCTIGAHLYPAIDAEVVKSLISYIMTIQDEVNAGGAFGILGRPWEFNLRDAMRWLELVEDQHGLFKGRSAADYLRLVISQRLRSPVDREHLDQIFEREIGNLPQNPPVYSFGLEIFEAGLAVAPRKTSIVSLQQSWNPPYLQQSATMELLTMCVQKAWPCLLVGPSGSSKTSMIRSIASSVGVSLKEFSMSSDTDATDIIGGYEQQDFNRQISQMAENVRVEISLLLAQSRESPEQCFYSDLISLLSSLQTLSYKASSVQIQIKEILGMKVQCPQYPVQMLEQLNRLLSESVSGTATGKFRWYDGVLVDALNQGDWIVLHNASLCNPSVLDRLNSLLEPSGSLILHEFTDADGNPRIIKPHKNFRLFLTLDPSYGELSRAMRNRAVEIAVDRPKTTSLGILFWFR
jgi:midasin